MRGIFIAAIAALAANVASANEYTLIQARSLFQQLSDEAQCEAALPEARTFWASSDFRTLPELTQSAWLLALGRCAWRMEDGQLVISVARAARELGATWADYYQLQAGIAFRDDRAAVEAFHALARSDARTLREMPWRFAWGAISAANRLDASGEEALRIHETLAERDYAPTEGGFTDALRVAHARLLLNRGQVDRARHRLEAVIDPREVMMLRVDRAFDPLRGDAAFLARLDVVAAAQAHLTRAQAAMREHPRRLAMVAEYAQALRALGREAEALSELDRHIALAQSANGAQRYDDTRDQLNWLLNERAYILYNLNRPEEARAAFGESIAVGEHGGWSVSQVINFAEMLSSEGRAADALEVVRTVGRASPYGDMWIAAVRACAAAQTGDAAIQTEALAFLREHADDNPAAITRAYLCVNDLDSAAAMYVSRLANPEQRDNALMALQVYQDIERPALPHSAVLLRRLDQVRARADVRAAVEAVGRIEEVPLRPVYWGDV